MSKSHAATRRTIQPRDGEGSLVEVESQQDISTGGQTVVSVGVNIAKAPVPDRKYTADVAVAIPGHGGVKLLFGQTRVDGQGLRTLIVLTVSGEGIKRILAGFRGLASPSVGEIRKNMKIEPEPILDVLEMEPAQTVEMSANLGLGAISGYESCVDFYHASPFAVAAVPHTHQLAIEPVVRVYLRTSLLCGLLDRLGVVEKSLPEVS